MSALCAALCALMIALPVFAGQCAATTQKGTRCLRNAAAGSGYCWQHGGAPAQETRRPVNVAQAERPAADNQCQKVTQRGTRCSRTASAGSPFCWQHKPADPKPAGKEASTPAGIAKRGGYPEVNMQLITETRRVLSATNGVYVVLDGAQKARLAGVVADNRATAFVLAFCGKQPLTVEYDTVESAYNHAKIYIRKDGKCLNEEIVRAGLGGVETGSAFRYSADFSQAEADARAAKRGLWAD